MLDQSGHYSSSAVTMSANDVLVYFAFDGVFFKLLFAKQIQIKEFNQTVEYDPRSDSFRINLLSFRAPKYKKENE